MVGFNQYTEVNVICAVTEHHKKKSPGAAQGASTTLRQHAGDLFLVRIENHATA